MSRRRRRHLLVPEARAALDSLKDQVIVSKTRGQSPITTRTMAPAYSVPNASDGWPAQTLQPVPSGTSLLSEFGSRRPKHSPINAPSVPTTGVGDVAKTLGIPYQPTGDNGNLTTRQAGRIGGQIGGAMVQRLISLAEQQLSQANETNPIGAIPNNRPTPISPRP